MHGTDAEDASCWSPMVIMPGTCHRAEGWSVGVGSINIGPSPLSVRTRPEECPYKSMISDRPGHIRRLQWGHLNILAHLLAKIQVGVLLVWLIVLNVSLGKLQKCYRLGNLVFLSKFLQLDTAEHGRQVVKGLFRGHQTRARAKRITGD